MATITMLDCYINEMRRVTLIVLFFSATVVQVVAQREYDTWYFGIRAGIQFGSGVPVGILGPINTEEGTSVWCDPLSGAPILSTDGSIVYDGTGSVLNNGTGLRGGFSSTNSALIVPDPGNSDRYYIFCAGDLSRSGIPDSVFTVNIVDMSGPGIGTVVSKNNILAYGTAEKIAGTVHCNGESWWVVAHDTATPRFYVFLVTASSIQGPTIYDVGEQYTKSPGKPGGYYGMGSLKFSASGRLLAMASPSGQMCEIFDFDIFSGVISNPRRVDSADLFYGLSFSPNERFLYSVCWNASADIQSPIYQYDLLNSFSKYRVGSLSVKKDRDNGGIQRGPDGKIYLVNGENMRAIDSPNLAGSACAFGRRIPLLAGTSSAIGLPTIMDCVLDNSSIDFCVPPISAMKNPTVACVGSCLTFTDASQRKPTEWYWDFLGGIPSAFTGKNPPMVCYSTAGIYRVRLITVNAWGADTTVSDIQILDVPTVNAGADIILCDSSYGKLRASGAMRYEWSPITGLNNQFKPDPIVRVFTTTQYVVRGWNDGECYNDDTVMVYVLEAPYPTDLFSINSVRGLAGSTSQLIITKTRVEYVTNATFAITIPRKIFISDSIVKGFVISSSLLRPDFQTLTIQADLSTDTVVIINGILLLDNSQEEVFAQTTTTDECVNVKTTPGSINSEACGASKRVIIGGSNPLSVISVSDQGKAITISGEPRSSYELTVWTATGELLARSADVIREPIQTVLFSRHFPQMLFIVLRSESVSTMVSVFNE
ncbi:MAG: hypothetical protein HYX66_08795 [Ignavibacteria bacterium]|nr:hypothetical protein [Ignavibacteria bacterium]